MYKTLDLLYKYIFYQADRVICLGRDIQTYLVNKKSIPIAKTVIITNWADEKNIPDSPLVHNFRTKHKIHDKFLVTYSGNIGLFHEFDTLMKAAKILMNKGESRVVFAVVGRGDQKKHVMSLAMKYKLTNMIFEDFLPKDEHYDLLASSDVLLSTLKTGVENCSVPSKTYPYLVSGKPVIAIMSPNSEIALTVTEENAGFVITPGDSDKLVEVLEQLANNPIYLIQLGINAKKAGKRRFTREVVTPMYEELLQSLDR